MSLPISTAAGRTPAGSFSCATRVTPPHSPASSRRTPARDRRRQTLPRTPSVPPICAIFVSFVSADYDTGQAAPLLSTNPVTVVLQTGAVSNVAGGGDVSNRTTRALFPPRSTHRQRWRVARRPRDRSPHRAWTCATARQHRGSPPATEARGVVALDVAEAEARIIMTLPRHARCPQPALGEKPSPRRPRRCKARVPRIIVRRLAEHACITYSLDSPATISSSAPGARNALMLTRPPRRERRASPQVSVDGKRHSQSRAASTSAPRARVPAPAPGRSPVEGRRR